MCYEPALQVQQQKQLVVTEYIALSYKHIARRNSSRSKYFDRNILSYQAFYRVLC